MARAEHSNHDSNQSQTQSPSENKYPLLTQFGITTDLSSPINRDRICSILRDIEKLNSDHGLSFMCMDSPTKKPFCIPNFISSKKSYDEW